jgi:hypothetical protein
MDECSKCEALEIELRQAREANRKLSDAVGRLVAELTVSKQELERSNASWIALRKAHQMEREDAIAKWREKRLRESRAGLKDGRLKFKAAPSYDDYMKRERGREGERKSRERADIDRSARVR